MKALITGTSAGIGHACAELFLQRGWHVYGFDIAPASIAHAEYEHFVVDVRDRAAFPAGLEPDVIVNNAGVQGADDIAVNLQGTINITEAYAFVGDFPAAKPAPWIRSVVNVGSASGHTGSEFPEYAASKGGILSYTKSVANRLATAGNLQQRRPRRRAYRAQSPRDGRRRHVGAHHAAHAAAPLGRTRRNRRVGLFRWRDEPLHDRPKPSYRWRRGGSRRIRVARRLDFMAHISDAQDEVGSQGLFHEKMEPELR